MFRVGLQPVRRSGRLPGRLSGDPGERSSAVMSRGGSCIIDPLGRILAGPDFDGPAILVADLDLDEIVRGKFDFDVVGHYARPDVFRLIVDDNPKRPVVRYDRSVE